MSTPKTNAGMSSTQHLSWLDYFSKDSCTLLLLLSSLKPSVVIASSFLLRGATPRKRWTPQGEAEEADALQAGLDPELVCILSDGPRLENAFHELQRLDAVSETGNQTYTLNEALATRVLGSLEQNLPFWRDQALIVMYRGIPWKYLEMW